MWRCMFLLVAAVGNLWGAESVVFSDDFKGGLKQGWSWIRENPKAWRTSEKGLEVLIEPGNMWGPANDGRNVLVRSLPEPGPDLWEISMSISNTPKAQYEQTDLVIYYDDSHMVKIGHEMVDGKVSIVMGREEKDKIRTMAVIPVNVDSVKVRFRLQGNTVRGQYQLPSSEAWKNAGECDLPGKGIPRVALQFYQGDKKYEHWSLVTGFKIVKLSN